MVDTFTLNNGVRAVVKKIDGVKSCSIGVFVRPCSCGETAEENGISHFIEHTNFKGTEKRNAFKISWDSDALGVILNAATSKEYTYYYVKTISEHVEKAFDILSDLFINSIYPAEELDKERGVVIEEINMYEDTPDDVCTTELIGAYYGDAPGYGKTILGPKSNIERFTRDDILKYRAKYYTTDNIVLAFVGDISPAQAALAEEKFACVKKSASADRIVKNLTPVYGTSRRVKDIEQAHLALAFKAAGQNDDVSYCYDVISNILGGGMSSRLFQKIREEMGLCYTVYSYLLPYVDSGIITVYAGLNGNKLSGAYQAVMDELIKLKKGGATEEEFNLVREQMKSSLVFAEESTSTQMNMYGRRLLLFNDIYDFDERLNKINSLTLKDINDCVFDLFDIDKFAVSTVGKQPKIDL